MNAPTAVEIEAANAALEETLKRTATNLVVLPTVMTARGSMAMVSWEVSGEIYLATGQSLNLALRRAVHLDEQRQEEERRQASEHDPEAVNP